MDDYLLQQHAELELTHWWFVGRRRILTDLLEIWGPESRPNQTVLDIGCGAGSMIDVLSRFGSVSAIDSSQAAVDYCSERFPYATVQVGWLPDGIPGSDSMDLITAFDVIEHIPADECAVRSIRAALVPNGIFVCTVPAYQWLWGSHDELSHHQRRYTHRSLVNLLTSAGLEVLWSSYYGTFLFPAVASIRVLRRATRRHLSAASDLDVPSGPFNGALTEIFSSERHLLKRLRFPFGSSLVAVARRPETS